MKEPVKRVRPKGPRATGAASSPARGLAAIEISTPQTEIIKQTASVIPFVIKLALLLGVGYLIVNKYNNRFKSLKYNSSYPDANITSAQAETRASAIYSSIGWFSNSFESVSQNLAGLNYNGFVKLYNAFGHHTGTLLGGDLDLIGWIKDQFSDDEVAQLRNLLGGQFF
jgi:hypothetical protein